VKGCRIGDPFLAAQMGVNRADEVRAVGAGRGENAVAQPRPARRRIVLRIVAEKDEKRRRPPIGSRPKKGNEKGSTLFTLRLEPACRPTRICHPTARPTF
jgi:hypothetical protein